MRKILYVFICWMFLSSPLMAATWYVCDTEADCDTGSAGNTDWETGVDTIAGGQGQSRGLPFKTPEYAMSSSSGVSAGDTIILGKGTYQDHDADDVACKITISGSNGNPITLKSETAWEAKIDGESKNYAIQIDQGIDYIDLEDLDITGGNNCLMVGKVNPTSLTGDINVTNCKIHDQADKYFYSSCVKTQKRTYNVVINRCKFYGCGTGSTGWAGQSTSLGYAIYIGGTEITIQNSIFHSPAIYAGPYIKIDGYDSNLDGQVAGYEIEIKNNTFDGYNLSGQTKRRNHIWLVGDGGEERANNLVLIANNAFSDPNNTSQGSLECGGLAVCIHNIGAYNANDVDFYNNRTEKELWGVYPGEDPLTCTESETQDEDEGWAANDFGFTDSGNDDYSLTYNSNMIDQGNASYAPAEDIIGTTRPQGGGDDIGAYEYNLFIYNASPGQGDTGVSITIDPSWTNPTGENTNDGYFKVGACPCDAGDSVWTNQAHQTSYDPGTLAYNTAHCWRVDIDHDGGTETGTNYGFTTTSQANPPPPPGSGIVWHKQGAKIVHHDKGMAIQ